MAHGITSVPGSRAYFLGAVVSYADRVKVGRRSGSADVLATHGAVSARSRSRWPRRARPERLATDLGVGVTGVAGPDGGSADEKPVGLVYIAVSDRLGSDVRRFHWDGRPGVEHPAASASRRCDS